MSQSTMQETYWSGILTFGSIELTLDLHIIMQDQHNYNATIDIAEQGVSAIPVDVISMQDEQLAFEVKKLNATYIGFLNPSRSNSSKLAS